MLEGGLMKFLAKGATEKIVEDAGEKRYRLHIRCQSPKYENGFKHLWHLASGNVLFG